MKNIVDENYEWFEQNYDNLQKNYKNKYLVIKEKKVDKDFSDFDSALEYSKKYEPGSYIIQKCAKDKNELVQFYQTRVRFND